MVYLHNPASIIRFINKMQIYLKSGMPRFTLG